jgi:atlastin
MEAYLATVLEEREAKDLKDTREQIATCFETISCFLLPHPGFAVTKKKYGGDIKAIEDMFLQLLDKYCQRVFDVDALQAKVIHGRELTASELEAFMKAYAGLFAGGAHFPETGTMLEATAMANNSNAISLSIANYRTEMDDLAGAGVTSFVKTEQFEENHLELLQKSLGVFDDIADFGSMSSIQSARERVLREIDGSFRMYEQLNQSRNPLMGFEM